ncbi:MAG: hypothetical protein IKU97_07505 [Tidjanibacter sp.]|nr:hypothetical protein [Tidjanibacter sp.]
MKHLVRIMSVVGVCSLLLAGCNSDYNFDKISLEVTIGDTEGITIPLGTTERITVESLLGEQNTLTPNEEGVYSISMSDAITETLNIGTLAPITGLTPILNPTTITFGGVGATISPISEQQSIPYPSGMNSGITIPSILAGQQLSMNYGPASFDHSIEIGLPTVVKSIDKVRFGENGGGCKVAITFDLAGVASVSQNRTIKNFTIATPAGFELQKISGDALDAYASLSKSSDSSTNNTYVLTNCPVNNDSITIQFLVMGVEFGNSTTEGNLTLNTGITYSFEMDYTIAAGTVGTTAPSIKAVADLTLYDASVTLNTWSESVEFSQNISESISLPKEVEAIDYITISSSSIASVVPQLNVALGLSGAPFSTINLSSLELTLPSVLDVEVPSGWTMSGNTLIAKNITLNNDTTNALVTLPLKGLKNISIVNGKANINGNIGVKATIGIAEGSKLTMNTRIQQISLTPTVTIDDINIRSISGRINPDLGGMIKPVEIEIGDLLGSLGKDVELDLNLASPTIDLAIENPIGVGINLAVKIDAWKSGSVVKSVTTPTIKILGAEGATPATTSVSLTGDAPKAGQTQVEGLTELINLLPEKLTVTLNATTDNTKAHTLLIKDSYTFKVNYSVGAALKFDATKNGRISYSMTIDNVDLSSVADVDLTIDTLTVNVDAQSTLPLDALLQIVFLDKDKNEITQIKSLTTGKIKSSKDGTPTSSQTSVGVRLYSNTSSAHFGALLSSVNAIRCTFEGTTLAGAGLKPDQWLQATLSLCLNDGLSVDLGVLAEGAGKK